jgi:hypothetical protein
MVLNLVNSYARHYTHFVSIIAIEPVDYVLFVQKLGLNKRKKIDYFIRLKILLHPTYGVKSIFIITNGLNAAKKEQNFPSKNKKNSRFIVRKRRNL